MGRLPTFINDLDDGAQRTIGNDALGAAPDGRHQRGLLAVPAPEGTESEGLTYPQHIVAIAFCLLLLIGIELRFFQLQLFLEFAIDEKINEPGRIRLGYTPALCRFTLLIPKDMKFTVKQEGAAFPKA